MNLIALARYYYRLSVIKPARYANLFRAIHQHRCRRILEIGVFDGVHAMWMIQTAHIHHPVRRIEYHGVDLFEWLTEDLLKEELAKKPPGRKEVETRLEATGANIRLYQGNSRQVLPTLWDTVGVMDLIFIDGGHSHETVVADWKNIQPFIGPETVVIFDDYLFNDEPEVRNIGCQMLVDGLDRSIFTVDVLEPTDTFEQPWGMLKTAMAMVRLHAGASAKGGEA